MPGARGAASMELLRRQLLNSPSVWAATIRRNAAATLGASSDDTDPRTHSMAEYMVRTGALIRPQKSTAYLGWGIARVCDMIQRGEWDKAEAYLLLMLVACEQSTKDAGRWHLAWVLSFQVEPPWGQMQSYAQEDLYRPFGALADPQWTTAAMAWARDAASLKEMRAKLTDDKKNPGDGDGEPAPKAKAKARPKSGA